MNNRNNDMIENLKHVMGEKQVNDALSQISPEMIENFSRMMNNNNSQSSNNNYNDNSQSSNYNYNSSNNNNSNNNSTNDFNIDIDTMMKMKSIIDKLNSNKDDPRSNLLNSLKPYMRESRQENIDKYANLLKMADLMTLLNDENNKKGESHNE